MKKNPATPRLKELYLKANWIRNKVLDMSVKAGAAHLAPSFSCTEILTTLYYGNILKFDPKNPEWENRDRFILSKGHAAVALYSILADLGFFPKEELDNFSQRGSHLGGLTELSVPGVEAFTGSLGHGLALGAGICLAAKLDRKKLFSFVLMGDGESHEGSVWETGMFAAHHELDNLIAITDHNGLSSIDHIEKYTRLEPLEKKWEAFGWEVKTVDGHSIESLLKVLRNIKTRKSRRPFMLIAKTTKGKGVSFMENRPIWHYRIPVGNELIQAKKELNRRTKPMSKGRS